MKKIILHLLFLLLFTAVSPSVLAIDSQLLPDVKPGIVSMTTTDPVQRVGYTIGDVVEREVTLDIKAPYKLIETSLPIVGYEKRYRGQVIGIELKNIEHSKKEHKDHTTHTIKLAYQIFTSDVVAKNKTLGPEYLSLINTKNSKDLVKYRIPFLSISVSPLAIFGQVKVENNMSPFLGPLLMSDEKERLWLKLSLGLMIISLLVLIYILGQRAWLPRMGGNFAKAYRNIKKTPDTEAGLKQAISRVHQSFNQSANISVFNDNLDEFLKLQPNFVAIKSEIQQFFGLSRQVYFEPNAHHEVGSQPLSWLLKFTRRCRDCERGLVPANQQEKA